MRYSPEHKQLARTKLIEAGAALAKKEGFSNTGMDALMAASGMTTGAFYSQFTSKSEFLQEIISQELSKTLAIFEGKTPEEMLKVLAWYLSPNHVQQPEQGCPIPALGAEVGRASENTKQQFEVLMVKIHAVLVPLVESEAAAWAILCQAVGGVMIARAMASVEKRDEVLSSVLEQAQSTIKQTNTIT